MNRSQGQRHPNRKRCPIIFDYYRILRIILLFVLTVLHFKWFRGLLRRVNPFIYRCVRWYAILPRDRFTCVDICWIYRAHMTKANQYYCLRCAPQSFHSYQQEYHEVVTYRWEVTSEFKSCCQCGDMLSKYTLPEVCDDVSHIEQVVPPFEYVEEDSDERVQWDLDDEEDYRDYDHFDYEAANEWDLMWEREEDAEVLYQAYLDRLFQHNDDSDDASTNDENNEQANDRGCASS